MKKKKSKNEVKKEIEDFFKNLEGKNSKDIKKIKNLAMAHKIPLKENRKKYCKKCYGPYGMPSIRIKNGKISFTCEECNFRSNWKIK